MTAVRASLALTLIATGATVLHFHHRNPASSATSVAPTGTVLSLVREPVPPRRRAPVRATRRHTRPALRVVQGALLDVTAYCPTGNRTASGEWPHAGGAASNLFPLGTHLRVGNLGEYVVNDRVGYGTDVDLFFEGPECDDRALAFGRKHLRVVVEQ